MALEGIITTPEILVADVMIGADVSSKEDKANKVTEITPESTNEQYPSAKAVYEALQEADTSGKEDKSNKTTELTAESTDEQYPSAKTVYDAIQNIDTSEKEDKTNKITDILENDYDDLKYPSALAVVKGIKGKVKNINGSLTREFTIYPDLTTTKFKIILSTIITLAPETGLYGECATEYNFEVTPNTNTTLTIQGLPEDIKWKTDEYTVVDETGKVSVEKGYTYQFSILDNKGIAVRWE